ncbi:MAG TPA: Fic family protein [Solirubrobacterales bacterium]|nr:Fic family protein [Solirubrobacterales bacterium]
MSDNRFARRLEELDPEERQLAEAAVRAAGTSFAGFEEKQESEYHQAPGLTPSQTWARVAEELGRVSALTTLAGHRDQGLVVADIELIHRGIFEPVFGDQVLGFRSEKTDKVEFPVVKGSRDSPVVCTRHACGGRRVGEKLRKALSVFEREVATLAALEEPELAEAVHVAIKLYAKVIGIHPFFDGNGRTAWAVFSYAVQRCGLVEVAIPPSGETRWALGQALRQQDRSQSYKPLTDLVANAIRDSA